MKKEKTQECEQDLLKGMMTETAHPEFAAVDVTNLTGVEKLLAM